MPQNATQRIATPQKTRHQKARHQKTKGKKTTREEDPMARQTNNHGQEREGKQKTMHDSTRYHT
jgi:hypothetical protein